MTLHEARGGNIDHSLTDEASTNMFAVLNENGEADINGDELNTESGFTRLVNRM